MPPIIQTVALDLQTFSVWTLPIAAHSMMTSSNGNIFHVTGPLCREFTGDRLSKQSWGWWFETPSCSLWRHCNDQIRVLQMSGNIWVLEKTTIVRPLQRPRSFYTCIVCNLGMCLFAEGNHHSNWIGTCGHRKKTAGPMKGSPEGRLNIKTPSYQYSDSH